jgi:hypothetical protein
MKTIDAAYNVVHDYPGGALALAPRLGKHASSLNNEVNPPANPVPGAPTPKFGIVDAIKITHLTGDVRIVAAFNEECGFCPPLRLGAAGVCEGTVTGAARARRRSIAPSPKMFAEFQDDHFRRQGHAARARRLRGSARSSDLRDRRARAVDATKMEVDQRSHVANVTAIAAKNGARRWHRAFGGSGPSLRGGQGKTSRARAGGGASNSASGHRSAL